MSVVTSCVRFRELGGQKAEAERERDKTENSFNQERVSYRCDLQCPRDDGKKGGRKLLLILSCLYSMAEITVRR